MSNPEVIRVWIKRSKDASRTKRERDYAWQKALELATLIVPHTAHAFTVYMPENGRMELWETGERYTSRQRNQVIKERRIYRTRAPGKWRTFNITGAYRRAQYLANLRAERATS